MEDVDGLHDECVIVCLHVKNLNKSILLFLRNLVVTLVVRVEHHQSSLTLMDILSKGASLLGIVLTGQSDQVILYLECGSQRNSVSDYSFGLFFC